MKTFNDIFTEKALSVLEEMAEYKKGNLHEAAGPKAIPFDPVFKKETATWIATTLKRDAANGLAASGEIVKSGAMKKEDLKEYIAKVLLDGLATKLGIKDITFKAK